MGATILVTGATGYIGGRLLRRFEQGGRPVRCLVRQPAGLGSTGLTTEVVQGDCLDEATLDRPLAGIDTAYYLVHSMAARREFADADRRAAQNFARAAARAGVRRIVYLGGLTDAEGSVSPHLKSRIETGEALRASGVPVVEFRAGIVVGAGSLSFEMMRALVERLPVMICPRWIATLTQPIAIDDVLAYLEAAVDLPEGSRGVFEIGGREVVSYGEMMRQYARLRGLRRLLVPVPVLTPRLSGLWLALVTPTQARVGRALVEGLKNATVVRSMTARETFRIQATPLRDAILKAIDDGAAERMRVDTRTALVDVPPALAFAPVRRIGGRTGWYFGNFLWRARGWLDRGLGGVGMTRGRRDAESCVVGDVIDGWTVESYEPDRRLRLSADFKLPGRGWLEFEVTPIDATRTCIRQTATFDPRGLLGRAYWYGSLALHALMFRGMLARIASRAVAADSDAPGIFVYRSLVSGRPDDVFRWHERPQALLDLLPSRRFVRIDRQTGGLRDGGYAAFSIGVGLLRVRWEARHYGYLFGERFCDEQTRGPFRTWQHTHRFVAVGSEQTLYEDRVEYATRGGALVAWLARPVVRTLLARMCARRHQIVRTAFANDGDAGLRGPVVGPGVTHAERLRML